MPDIEIPASEFIIDRAGQSYAEPPSYETIAKACAGLMQTRDTLMAMLWGVLAANNGEVRIPLVYTQEPVGQVKWDNDGTTVRLMAILPTPEALQNKAYI